MPWVRIPNKKQAGFSFAMPGKSVIAVTDICD
jgi:hypothetical protein